MRLRDTTLTTSDLELHSPHSSFNSQILLGRTCGYVLGLLILDSGTQKFWKKAGSKDETWKDRMGGKELNTNFN